MRLRRTKKRERALCRRRRQRAAVATNPAPDAVVDAVGDAMRDSARGAMEGAAGGANVGAIPPCGIRYNCGTIDLTFNK